MSLFFPSHWKIETGIYTANSKTWVSKMRQQSKKRAVELGSPTLLLLSTSWSHWLYFSDKGENTYFQVKGFSDQGTEGKKGEVQRGRTWVLGEFLQFISCLAFGHQLLLLLVFLSVTGSSHMSLTVSCHQMKGCIQTSCTLLSTRQRECLQAKTPPFPLVKMLQYIVQ